MSEYNIGEVVEKFNKTVKRIINIIYNSGYDSILLDTIKRKIFLVINTHPTMLIEDLGPEIFIFRDYIKNGLDELINNYENILLNNQELKKKLTDVSNELLNNSNNHINNILETLKSSWNIYSNDEKQIIRKQFSILLSEYCKFITIKGEKV